MDDQAPKSKARRPSLPIAAKPRRPSLPIPAIPPTTYGRPIYGQSQERTLRTVVVTVTLRLDAAAAVLDLVKRHGLSRSGAAHHLIRLGAGLPPLPPLV
jgi:hypothetical protein